MAEQLDTKELQDFEEPLPDQIDHGTHLMGKAGLVLAGGLLGAAAGFGYALHTPTETHVGGLDASVEIMHGTMHRVDLRVLGANIPSTLHVGGQDISARITLKGLSDDNTSSYENTDIDSALQLFSDPKHDIQTVSNAVETRLWETPLWGSLIGSSGAVVALGGINLVRRRMDSDRRAAFHDAFNVSPRTKIIAGIAAGTVAFGGMVGSIATIPAAPRSTGHADSVFNGTPLQGTELTGLLKPVVDNAAPAIEKYITDNDAFYDSVRNNTQDEFGAVIGAIQKDPHDRLIVVASDRHCNVGMDRVIAKVATLYDADIYASAGDDDMSGTVSLESACTAGVAERLRAENIKLVVAPGNHDSAETIKNEKMQGYTVLADDTIASINGVTFIGDADPRRSAFGHPLTPGGVAGDKVIAKEGQDLKDAACNSKTYIDIGIVHEPPAAEALTQSGCATLTVSGHLHVKKGPFAYTADNGNTTYHLTEGTSGGAKEDSVTLGPLKGVATLSVYKFNTETRTFQYSNVTIYPDKHVVITPFSDMPIPANIQVKPLPSNKNSLATAKNH